MSETAPCCAPPDRAALMAALAPFQAPSLRRSVWQVVSTFAGYLALNAAMYALAGHAVWIGLALAFPAAGLLVRIFIIQHDCGHGSFFRSRRMNDALGGVCSVFTVTPYAFWRRQHANHHACFNNLDRRDTGIDLYSTCATVAEYRAMTRPRRLWYAAVRHPVVAQLVLPPLLFLVVYRVCFDAPASWRRERRSVWMTNVALGAILATLTVVFGWRAVLLVQLPIIALASIIGVWLFSVQHRFEETIWQRQSGWNHMQASLRGSSYLKLPRILQWFTGNIGFHHVHHLSARVPNYRLQACHASRREFQNVATLTLWQALGAPCFALWDEELGRMVRFSTDSRAKPRGAERRATAPHARGAVATPPAGAVRNGDL